MPSGSGLSLIKFLFLVVFIISATSFADIEVTDEHGDLQSLPGRSDISFDSAFTCNQPTNFFIKTGKCKLHCEFGLCEEQCGWPNIVSATIQPEDCNENSVSLYSSLGHEMTVTKTDYQAASNSIALTIVKSITLFYDAIEKVRIDQVMFPVRKNFIENGEMKTVMVTVVVFSMFPDKTKEESQGMMLTLDLNQTGLNQVMCLASNGSCETQDYFIKRKGLVNAIN